MLALTDLATRALVIQGAEGDGGEEDGDVEEDGRGHVLQQGFITADDTWGGKTESDSGSNLETARCSLLGRRNIQSVRL